MAHALLSPSSASRWLACTPSARLEASLPEPPTSGFAEEGTLAHAVAESELCRLTTAAPGPGSEALFGENPMYNTAMQEHAEDYAAFVFGVYREALNTTPHARLFTETRLDLSRYVPGAFGTADAIVIGDDELHIIDYKYGQGVAVSAENNKQMMLYATGALEVYGVIYGVRRVLMTIYQPRLGNISTFEMDADALMRWAETELLELAKMADKGDGEYRPGTHCRFCRAKAVCKANAEEQLEVLKYDFANPDLLTDADIVDVLARVDALEDWLKAVEAHAFMQALAGKEWPGWKLVEGRSVRKYTDETAVAEKLKSDGIPEAMIYERRLLGITAMEKMITKKRFTELLSELVEKPAGKPTLAPVSDKRPVWSPGESVTLDFKAID